MTKTLKVEAVADVQFSGRGELYSYTIVTEAAEGFDEQAPFILAWVKLAEGPMLTAQLTDLDGEPTIGMPLEMVTRRLRAEGDQGVIVYGYKFRPVHQ